MSDNRLYDVLGLSRGATESEIKKEYHKLAKRYHPDKNPGFEDRFKEIQEAYEILGNSEKRETYDRFGLEAVKGESSGGMEGGFPFGGDGLFSQLFGGADLFGMGGRRRKTKGETVGIPLEITLEELFNGATKHVEYKRKELCKTCKGIGGRHGSSMKCSKCRGSGTEIKLRQIGPGMMQQMQSVCSDCGGSGDFIREKDRCKKCKGKRVLELNHKLEVPITPGMKSDQKIPFRGEADQVPDGEAGDVVVVLQLQPHSVFRRDGLDLFVEKKISLRDALCGFSFYFTHLDGTKLKVSCPPGDVLPPNCVRALEGVGMHDVRHHDMRGNTYFIFDVEFPADSFLPYDKLEDLEKLLPSKPDVVEVTDDMEEVHMIDLDGTAAGGGDKYGEAYNESDDEDDGRHAQRAGCQQQ